MSIGINTPRMLGVMSQDFNTEDKEFNASVADLDHSMVELPYRSYQRKQKLLDNLGLYTTGYLKLDTKAWET